MDTHTLGPLTKDQIVTAINAQRDEAVALLCVRVAQPSLPCAGIHGIDKWVSISSLQQVTSVLALFIACWCGLNRLAA